MPIAKAVSVAAAGTVTSFAAGASSAAPHVAHYGRQHTTTGSTKRRGREVWE